MMTNKIEFGLDAIATLAGALSGGRGKDALVSTLLYDYVRDVRYAIEDSKAVKTAPVTLSDWPAPSLDVDDNELFLARYKGKIAAIKAYRGRVRCGLKDAKDAVENEVNRRQYSFGPAQSPHAEAARNW